MNIDTDDRITPRRITIDQSGYRAFSNQHSLFDFPPRRLHQQLTEHLFDTDQFSIVVLNTLASYAAKSRSKPLVSHLSHHKPHMLNLEDQICNKKLEELVRYTSLRIVLPADLEVMMELLFSSSSCYLHGFTLGAYLKFLSEDLLKEFREIDFLNRIVSRKFRFITGETLEGLSTTLQQKVSRKIIKQIQNRSNSFIDSSAWRYINTEWEDTAHEINQRDCISTVPRNLIDGLNPEIRRKIAPLLHHYSSYRYILQLEKKHTK